LDHFLFSIYWEQYSNTPKNYGSISCCATLARWISGCLSVQWPIWPPGERVPFCQSDYCLYWNQAGDDWGDPFHSKEPPHIIYIYTSYIYNIAYIIWLIIYLYIHHMRWQNIWMIWNRKRLVGRASCHCHFLFLWFFQKNDDDWGVHPEEYMVGVLVLFAIGSEGRIEVPSLDWFTGQF